MMKPSPLAPSVESPILPVKGFRLAVGESGIKYQNRPDMMLLVADRATATAGVFTTSKTASAPVDWCRGAIKNNIAQAVFVNAGNANAFTGRYGVETVQHTAQAVSQTLNTPMENILIASTGVIGEPLDAGLLTCHLPSLYQGLGEGNWRDGAEAIRTTDTFPKAASRSITLGGTPITLTGIAKGSGMIAPNMATMLGFIATDANITPDTLQKLTETAVEVSFNAITVDSDTSTSDTVLVLASGEAQNTPITDPQSTDAGIFADALTDLMIELAQLIVRDGEGASKFITITVTGAEDTKSARAIGFSIANAPLVKTAIAGGDANWGRIVMAVGKSGEAINRDSLAIRIGGTLVAENGERVADYDETPIAQHIKGDEITIEVAVGVGVGVATVWTCDLTHDYIAINADYRS